jgi:hypothetical protein
MLGFMQPQVAGDASISRRAFCSGVSGIRSTRSHTWALTPALLDGRQSPETFHYRLNHAPATTELSKPGVREPAAGML